VYKNSLSVLKSLTNRQFLRVIQGLSFTIISLISYSQVVDSIALKHIYYQPDTAIEEGYLYIINHRGDTFIYRPFQDEGENIRKQKAQQFYDSLKVKFENRKITRELYRILFTDTAKKQKVQRVINPENFSIYEDKIIRNITVKHLNVFGTSVDDTIAARLTFPERLANNVHIKTGIRVIQRNMLIKEGDRLNPYLLFENERLIRDLPYIEDARFLITDLNNHSDSVDILLIVKDVWPAGFGFQINDLNSGNLSVWHTNTFGLGHQFRSDIFYNTAKDNPFGYDVSYSVASVFGSYISTDLLYVNRWNTETYKIDLYRSFLTSTINWAGAAHLEKTKTEQDILLKDTTLEGISFEYHYHDLWLGRSFEIMDHYGRIPQKMNFFIASRILYNNFLKAPETSQNYLYRFHNKTLWLFSIGLSKQGFYRSSFIYGFGRAEDVPFGFLVKLTGGWEKSQYMSRPYMALSASGAINIRSFGYAYNVLEFGSFYNNQQVEQGVFHLVTKYYTDLFKIKRFAFRQFVTFDYTLGINRYEDEYTTLENRGGINGLKSRYLRGDEKVALKLESVLFTPYKLIGFRVALFASADMGIIKGSNFASVNNRLFSGIGIGVRIRNENLVFNTIQLKYTWYPYLPNEAVYYNFTAEGEPRLRLRNLYMDEPQIVNF
jgi:hypothetical protein